MATLIIVNVANANTGGIDVSRWQGLIDWNAVRNETGFALIKAGGSDDGFYTDSQFYQNRDEARRLAIPHGFYYYAGGGNPVQEAQHFASIVGPLQPGEVVAMDLEIDIPDPVNYALQFLNQSDRLFGVKPLLYTNMNRVVSYNWAPVVNNGNHLWEAVYDGNPAAVAASGSWPAPVIKQYSDGGVLAGMNGNTVDLDVLENGVPALQSLGKSTTHPAPPAARAGKSQPAGTKKQSGGKNSSPGKVKKDDAHVANGHFLRVGGKAEAVDLPVDPLNLHSSGLSGQDSGAKLPPGQLPRTRIFSGGNGRTVDLNIVCVPDLKPFGKKITIKEPPAKGRVGKAQPQKPGAPADAVKTKTKPAVSKAKKRSTKEAKPGAGSQTQTNKAVQSPAGRPPSTAAGAPAGTTGAASADTQQSKSQKAAMDVLINPLIGPAPGANPPAASDEKTAAGSVQTAVYSLISSL